VNLALDLVDAPAERGCFAVLPIQKPGELLLETSERVFDDGGMEELLPRSRGNRAPAVYLAWTVLLQF
jgi:hypothetical protein